MKFLIFLLNFVFSIPWDSILLLTSLKTPPQLTRHFPFSPSTDISNIFQFYSNSTFLLPTLILDISLDPSSFAVLDIFSQIYKIPYLTITKSFSSEYSEWRFSVFPPKDDEAKAMVELLNYFSWDSFSVFLSSSKENLEMVDMIKKELKGKKVKSFIYNQEVSEENLDTLVKRFLKITGERKIIVLDEGSSLEKLVKYLKIRKIDQFGSFFLFGTRSIYSVDLEGSVILSNELENFPESLESFYFEVLKIILNKFTHFSIQALKKTCQDSFCSSKFLIINQQNKSKKPTGSFNPSLKITEKMIFPGNNTSISPSITKTSIPLLIANGTSEPNSLKSSPFTSNYYHGAIHAMQEVNKNLKNFEYNLIPTDCGNNYFNISWTASCLSQFFQSPALAYVSGFWPEGALANLLSFQSFQEFLPQISPYGISDLTNNKTIYPEFLKFSGRLDEYIKNSVFLFRFYNWKDVLYLASDENISRIIFQQINQIFQSLGLNVLTPEEFRYVPQNYSREDFQKFRGIFEFVKKSGCRILMIAINNPVMILEALYDIGLRRGDLVIITSIQNYLNVNEEVQEKYLKKRIEILEGALLTSLIEFDGEIGKRVQRELMEKYDSVENMCLTYDSFLVVHSAVEYLMGKGENYDDRFLLMQTMRGQRFVGCTGDVFFIPNENSRNNAWMGILQVSIDPVTRKTRITQITALNIFAVIAAKQINEPMWATGEKDTPSNYRQSTRCIFDKDKEISRAAMNFLHFFSGFCLITAGVVAFLSKVTYEKPLLDINDKVIPSYQDFLFRAFFFCEFFQILALEPQGGIIEKSFKGFSYQAGLDFITMFDLKFNYYWKFYSMLIGFSLVFLCFACVFVIGNKKINQLSNFFNHFDWLPELALPVIGHFGFMPICLMLMTIFKCEKGTSENLSDSILFYDCSQFCYRGKHKTYVILSTIIIFLFISISTFLRPFWESTQTSLKINTKPSFLSIKSVFQLSLVLIKVNFETYSEAISGFLICGMLFFMILVTSRMKPFNYQKVNILNVIILVMSFWGMLISTINSLVSHDNEMKICLFLGLFFILLAGLRLAARTPAKFIEDDENSISIFFRFQFSSKLPEIITKSKYLERVRSTGNNTSHIPICHQNE